ncbi:Eukaryotic rRNA processing [Dillenia turbinata]|uniref:Eukaryotic rRNA processing n=1 Tax=Dillenia turbinata TaxID=194707 RepID=A0AAN8VR39_9MAGN
MEMTISPNFLNTNPYKHLFDLVLKADLTLFSRAKMIDDDLDLNGQISGSESESEYEGSEVVRLAEPAKESIYNKDGLIDKLGDISWPDNVEWIHKLSVDIDTQEDVNVEDDIARELSFFTQALEGTRQAFVKLESMGLPFLRPSDYYAEMVKTDSHMEKIRGSLLAEKREIEEREEKRKAREAKKLAKEVQAEKQKERAKQKKEMIESVKKWRKQRQRNGFAGGDEDGEMVMDFEEGKAFERSSKKRPGVSPGDRSGGKAGQFGGKGKKGMNKKANRREFRNSKFGFGGRKGLKKQNTAETTDDLGSFNKSNPRNKRHKA